MEFVSVRATAERWGVSVRNVQRLLKEERIHGAYKCSGCWMIPADAPKPDDPRRERKKAREAKTLRLRRRKRKRFGHGGWGMAFCPSSSPCPGATRMRCCPC